MRLLKDPIVQNGKQEQKSGHCMVFKNKQLNKGH